MWDLVRNGYCVTSWRCDSCAATSTGELHGGGSRFVMLRELVGGAPDARYTFAMCCCFGGLVALVCMHVVSGPVTEPGDVANQRERLAIEGQPPLQLIIVEGSRAHQCD